MDGVRRPCERETLDAMYRCLDARGELYFIEAMEDGVFYPIGDAAFSQNDTPVVIGEARWHGRGVGRRLIAALVDRARSLGYRRLRVAEIYDWNEPSRRCFESAGFTACGKTERGRSREPQIE